MCSALLCKTERSMYNTSKFFNISIYLNRAFQVMLVVKNLPAKAGDVRDMGSIPGSGRSSGKGNGNTLQYSCLENPMDRGAWQSIVHGITRLATT